MTDYVYFIEADNGLVKIGKSKNVRKRLAALRGGSPIHLRLLYSIDCNGRASETEKHFHKMFEAKRKHGEWFGLNKKEKRDIMRMGADATGRIEGDDFICPNCLKSVRGKSGLTNHKRFCNGEDCAERFSRRGE